MTPRFIAIPLLATLVLGCISLERSAEPRYFSPLEPERPSAAAPGTEQGTALRLRRVQGASHLKERIVWRRSGVEYGFYELRRWTQAPARYVEQRVARELFENRGFRRASSGLGVTLELDVVAFDEVLTPVHAVDVAIAFRLLGADNLALLEHTIRERRPLPGNDPADVAREFGEALDAAVRRIGESVAGAL